MVEFLQNLNLQDIWVALLGFASLNGLTIIGLIVAWAKGKVKSGMQIEEVKATAKAETDAVISQCVDAIDGVKEVIKDLEIRINDAIKATAEAEQKEIEAKSIKLTETLNQAKATAINLSEEIDKL